MDKTFFDGITTEQVTLSTGARIGLPVRFYDWSMMMAHFPVPAAGVRKLLPSDKLKPAQLIPGLAVVTLAAIEYRQIADVGPYNEFGIMIPVLYQPAVNLPGLPLLFPQWFRQFGVYIRHLPVTTEEALVYGVELWGDPKFIAEINFEETGRQRRCQLRAEGKDILTLEVEKVATSERFVNYYTYTVKDGRILRTLMQFQGEIGVARLRGGASCILGDHPVADELRALDLCKTAVERIYAPRVQSLLYPAGERLPL